MKRNVSQRKFVFKDNMKLRHETNEFTFVENKNEMLSDNIKSNQVFTTEKDVDIYFNHILENLNTEIPDDEREILFQNVLNQVKGHELQLSCGSSSSRCLELLLNESNDLNVILGFMKAFSLNFEEACGNCFASHITETLLYLGLKNMQAWSSIIEVDKKKTMSEEANNIISIITWIHSLGEFCLKNLSVCFEDAYACYVLKTVIQVLGGYFISDVSHHNKKQKKYVEDKSFGTKYDLKLKEDISLIAVPKFFIEILKKIAKYVIKLKNLKDYAIQPETSTVIQALLFILKRRLPNCCKRLISKLSSQLFDVKTNEGISEVLLHKNCSYVVEKIFNSADEDQQKELWTTQIEPFLEILIKHPVANYIIQRMFDIVDSKDQFEFMCQSISKYFDVIYESHHYGLWVTIAGACNRLKAQQAYYMTNIMQCLNCLDSEEKQAQLIPVILSLKKQECLTKGNDCTKPELTITLQGSLIVQAIFRFEKPLKAVKSILKMKSSEIAFLASHNQGCHVLLSFFNSMTVGEKSKDNFLHVFKPALVNIACDRNGNLTLSRLWMLMTMKQKSLVAEELSKSEHLLQQNKQGFGIFKKFGLYQYKRKREEWKLVQQDLIKKRKHPNNTE